MSGSHELQASHREAARAAAESRLAANRHHTPNVENPMTSVHFVWRREGGHIYVRVFTSEFGPGTTHGKNGDLVFRPQEWDAILATMGSSSGVDDDGRPIVFHSFYDDVDESDLGFDEPPEILRFTFTQTPDH